jgi:cystathionine beta-lyase/cystathionine gamma-synthase
LLSRFPIDLLTNTHTQNNKLHVHGEKSNSRHHSADHSNPKVETATAVVATTATAAAIFLWEITLSSAGGHTLVRISGLFQA